MKWFSVLLVGALALLTNACEMHKASELEEEPAGGAEASAELKEGSTAVNPDTAKATEKKTDDGKPGEAPKFFPDKK